MADMGPLATSANSTDSPDGTIEAPGAPGEPGPPGTGATAALTTPLITVLHVLPWAEAGGTERQAESLVRVISRSSGWRFLVAMPNGVGRDRLLAAGASPADVVIPYPMGVGGYRAAARALRSLIHRERVDVVHVHASRELAWGLGGTAPLVFTPHAYVSRADAWMAARLAGSRAAKVICMTAGEADDLARLGLPRAKVAMVPNGVRVPTDEELGALRRLALVDASNSSGRAYGRGLGDTSGPTPSAPTSPASRGEIVVGVLARLHRDKGIADLVRAVGLATGGAESGDNRRTGAPMRPLGLRLVIGGDGPELPALRGLVTELGLEARVTFVGHVADPFAFAVGLDIFVLPSYRENCSLALAEAMACGIPAVATPVGAAPDMLAPLSATATATGAEVAQAAGILVGIRDVDALAAALRRLAADVAGRQAMGARAREVIATGYSDERCAASTAAVYRSLCE